MGVLRRPGRRGKNQALARNGGKAIKIFIISDLHGSAAAFERAAAAFEREKADLMLVCGDYLNHGPRNDIPEGYDTKALAARLNAFKARLCAVRGNCDSEVDQMVLDFPVLSATAQIFLPPFCDCNCGEGLADGEKPTDKGANSRNFANITCVGAADETSACEITTETMNEAYADKTCGGKSNADGGSFAGAGCAGAAGGNATETAGEAYAGKTCGSKSSADGGSFAGAGCVGAAGGNATETAGEAYAGKTCGGKSSAGEKIFAGADCAGATNKASTGGRTTETEDKAYTGTSRLGTADENPTNGSSSTTDFRPCGRIFAHHGHSISEEQAAALTVAGTIIVSGHTHVPVLEQRGGRMFVNPGSISIPKCGSAAGYAVIDAPASGASLSVALKTLSGELVEELTWART